MEQLLRLKEIVVNEDQIDSRLKNMIEYISDRNYAILFTIMQKKCHEYMLDNEGSGCHLLSIYGFENLERHLKRNSSCFSFCNDVAHMDDQTAEENLEDIVYSIHFSKNGKPVSNYELSRLFNDYLHKLDIKCYVKRENDYLHFDSDNYSEFKHHLEDNDEIFITGLESSLSKKYL